MPICVKCNTSIKPASLETNVAGKSYHPTCIQCTTCSKPLWGKPFKRTKDGTLVCEQPCNPRQRTFTLEDTPPQPPQSTQQSIRPPSANKMRQPEQKQLSLAIDQQFEQQQQIQFQNNNPLESYRKSNQPPPHGYFEQPDLSMYKKPLQENPNNGYSNRSQIPPSYYQNKFCKVCSQTVFNKRFITFENGEIICQECDNKVNMRPARVNSAHMIVCSVCDNMVRGSKYFTEPNGKIVCENCELNGARCSKCKALFLSNDKRRVLPSMPNYTYHEYCFNCVECQKIIDSTDFYQNEHGLPMCLSCFEISRLPRCTACSKHLSGPYILIENKPIHKECFVCTNCNLTINPDLGFFKNKLNDQPICGNCNLKLNGSRCDKCKDVIEKDGISFSFKDYHKHCFNCDKCGTSLVLMKRTLTDKENKLIFCDPCFTQNFLPKCFKCNNPITPHLPGTNYENNTYHKDCFSCGRCKRTLADKKFFKAGSILICENCY